MTNEQILFPIFKELYNKLQNNDIVDDTVELLGVRLELDPRQKILDFGVRKTPIEYAEKEIKWYDSKNLNVIGWMDDIKIWLKISDLNGFINSNYGYLIYSKENGNQYDNCFNNLIKNPNTRQAIMIYNRPSMHTDWNKKGMHDFICTLANHFFIRNNKLYSIWIQRSVDWIYGWCGTDFYWACTVYERLFSDLKNYYPNLIDGNLIFFGNSVHIYKRHWDILKQIIKTNETNFK
jgi:thymidylate synthase